MLASASDGCPACKRKKSDQVTDLDTGEIQGGELLLRRANRAETEPNRVKGTERAFALFLLSNLLETIFK